MCPFPFLFLNYLLFPEGANTYKEDELSTDSTKPVAAQHQHHNTCGVVCPLAVDCNSICLPSCDKIREIFCREGKE